MNLKPVILTLISSNVKMLIASY